MLTTPSCCQGWKREKERELEMTDRQTDRHTHTHTHTHTWYLAQQSPEVMMGSRHRTVGMSVH